MIFLYHLVVKCILESLGLNYNRKKMFSFKQALEHRLLREL